LNVKTDHEEAILADADRLNLIWDLRAL